MPGRIASLYRYPVKGFTPEPLETATLTAGGYFPCDRLYAVENGPSGFDPAAPAHISKGKFTVLARIADIARVRTVYDDAGGVFSVAAPGHAPFAGNLRTPEGREAFTAWLTGFLDPEDVNGPLKVVMAPPHRFTDHPAGHVSVVNLESVRDLASRLGRPVDPLRFRANLYVEGWPAWSELEWAKGAAMGIGGAEAVIYAPITRCVATHVDPVTAERDIDVCAALHDLYGHLLCGLYLTVTRGGPIKVGDEIRARAWA